MNGSDRGEAGGNSPDISLSTLFRGCGQVCGVVQASCRCVRARQRQHRSKLFIVEVKTEVRALVDRDQAIYACRLWWGPL